ncbi:aminotransferase class I/II-fold pyridoxal phosphate-dependent enzyme [Sphingomonas sp. TDK1]|uniref:aminotransferase class I/II-fold pyridoxal phosphate-dependent enzyme n=1 Tax=Sphingomonas sp. TDK1 TaxID=453247 RepID=UPI0007D8F230|nr:aminotransferase class I/II-fold pyridoxal phosphate-dependent enzyme [Sphingomonas sp. TDK1]OAN60157.1 threonine-phosphate decarboxylase [Sphingomonas sp. TDK1]
MSDPLLHHGGNLAAARARFGDGPWLDLSTGINPKAWPVPDALDVDLGPLPDPAALAALEAAAAEHFGVAAEQLCAVPGSEMGLRLLGTILGGRACHIVPGYRTHAAAFPDSTPLAADSPIAGDAALLLANPNNPLGILLDRDTLEAMLAERTAKGGWLIVDEAFADAHPNASIAALVHEDRRLIVFRSFGKFFGLAGVRLGFVLAPRPILARYRAMLGDWPIDATALAIGTRAYRDARWIAATREALGVRAAAFDSLLNAHGLMAMGESPLFRLVAHAEAPTLFERLARANILVRPFDYAPHWLRFGMPADPDALARIDRVLRDG